MLKVGDPAPAFTAQTDSGQTVSLADFRGKKVVLYFYPKDDTPGCTREACGFRDLWGDLEKAGAVVLGISPDDEASHARFRDKYKLPFRLLADPDLCLRLSRAARARADQFGWESVLPQWLELLATLDGGAGGRH